MSSSLYLICIVYHCKCHKCRPLGQWKYKLLVSSISSQYEHWGDAFIFMSYTILLQFIIMLLNLNWNVVLFPLQLLKFWWNYQPIVPPTVNKFHSTWTRGSHQYKDDAPPSQEIPFWRQYRDLAGAPLHIATPTLTFLYRFPVPGTTMVHCGTKRVLVLYRRAYR